MSWTAGTCDSPLHRAICGPPLACRAALPTPHDGAQIRKTPPGNVRRAAPKLPLSRETRSLARSLGGTPAPWPPAGLVNGLTRLASALKWPVLP